jgi:protein-disulfide isomerase
LDGAAFARCLDGKLTAENVAADIQLAADFHIESTPTIFIGQEFISGAAPYEDLQVLIESALAK